jgi:hypothetical protein
VTMTQRRSCPSQSVLVVGFGEEMLPPPPPPGPVVVCRRPATFLGCFNIENRSSPLLPKAESLYHDRLSLERCAMQCAVSWPFPSWNRSTLTEIYLCHACSCQEVLRTETAGQAHNLSAAGVDAGNHCRCGLPAQLVTPEASRPFPSRNRSILTEIYLCHACSYHAIEDGNGRPGERAGASAGGVPGVQLHRHQQGLCVQRERQRVRVRREVRRHGADAGL